MPILNLNINRREYEIACDKGEEQHLMNLSYELDRRVKDLSKSVGTGNQSLLLVVSALQLLDELYTARTGGAVQQQDIQATIQEQVDGITAATLSNITSKIEEITAKLEKKAV